MVQQKLVHWTGAFCGVAANMSINPSVLVKVRHWLPIITYCPVNNLPDFVYVTVTLKDDFAELYALRNRIRKLCSGRKMFMEDITKLVYDQLFLCDGLHGLQSVELRLAFSRHVVTVTRDGAEP